MDEQILKDLDRMCESKNTNKNNTNEDNVIDALLKMDENELTIIKKRIDFLLEKKQGEVKRFHEKHFIQTQDLNYDQNSLGWLDSL